MGHEEAVFHQPNMLFCQQKETEQQVERVPADDSGTFRLLDRRLYLHRAGKDESCQRDGDRARELARYHGCN